VSTLREREAQGQGPQKVATTKRPKNRHLGLHMAQLARTPARVLKRKGCRLQRRAGLGGARISGMPPPISTRGLPRALGTLPATLVSLHTWLPILPGTSCELYNRAYPVKGLERNNLVISGGSSSGNRSNDQVNKVQPLTPMGNPASFYKRLSTQPGREDVPRRVDVPIVRRTAAGTHPLSHSKICDTSRPRRW
jgi:hypothetical protein